MLLLFEGVDKSGKSTLIRNFQDLSGMPVFKNTIKPIGSDSKLIGKINGVYLGAYQAANLSRNDLIFDRSHITENVYARIKRSYEPDEAFWLDWEEQNTHRVVLVYVDTPAETLRKRFVADEEEYVNQFEIELLQNSYKNYLNKSPLSLLYIDGSLSKQRMLTQLVVQLQNLGVWSAVRQR